MHLQRERSRATTAAMKYWRLQQGAITAEGSGRNDPTPLRHACSFNVRACSRNMTFASRDYKRVWNLKLMKPAQSPFWWFTRTWTCWGTFIPGRAWLYLSLDSSDRSRFQNWKLRKTIDASGGVSKDRGHRLRQQNSREKNKKKKTLGPTASKDLVPRQRQGGRQQNSREKNKKKKTVGTTASKDLIPRQRQGGRQQNLKNVLTHRRKHCWNFSVKRSRNKKKMARIVFRCSKRTGLQDKLTFHFFLNLKIRVWRKTLQND